MSSPENYIVTLTLLTGSRAIGGPGWYISGFAGKTGEGEIPPLQRVSTKAAEEIARAIGENVDPETKPHPFEIVTKGSEAAKRIVQGELEEAEEYATKVPALRKAMENL